ncbi:MAG: amino acid permease, partial [Candidatus Methanomethylophilaceae archaeon]|nr:amino acid permease [Candidatus Methanomethylophilaceae archaeon]
MTENGMESQASTGLARTLTWKQGLIVAMGVPILIIPSVADVSGPMWALSIVIWVLSVLSGFLINLPIGEMCATFGVAGIGGSIQYVFEDDEKYKNKRINTGRLIGAIGAWSYFVAWVTVIPIFTIMVAYYLMEALDLSGLDPMMETLLYVGVGVVVYTYSIGSSLKGLEGGAKFQLILTLLT